MKSQCHVHTRRIVTAIVTVGAVLSVNHVPAHATTSPGWTVSGQVFVRAHGAWRRATAVRSLDTVRGVVVVRGAGLNSGRLHATMEIRHLSWQGFRPVIMPPAVAVGMTRTGVSAGAATFAVAAQLPTLLPTNWSVVRFRVTDGKHEIVTSAGFTVQGVARRTAGNTLTIPAARSFCAARVRLDYIPYAVYLHGYYQPTITGSDGPPTGVVLERPVRVTPTEMSRLIRGTVRGALQSGGFGFPRAGWHTLPGELICSRRGAEGFSPES